MTNLLEELEGLKVNTEGEAIEYENIYNKAIEEAKSIVEKAMLSKDEKGHFIFKITTGKTCSSECEFCENLREKFEKLTKEG